MPDITPTNTLYCTFNSTTASTPAVTWSTNVATYDTTNEFLGPGLNIDVTGGVQASVLLTTQSGLFTPQRGTVSFWAKLTGNTQAASIISQNPGFPGQPKFNFTYDAPAVFTGSISGTTLTVTSVASGNLLTEANGLLTGSGVAAGTHILDYASGSTPGGVGTYDIDVSQTVASTSMIAYFALRLPIGFDGYSTDGRGVFNNLQTDNFAWPLNTWHNFIWVWEGLHHQLYRDGVLVDDLIAWSAFGTTWTPNFNVGSGAASDQNMTIDELGIYNFPFNATDIANTFAQSTSTPTSASGTYGVSVEALWAPGISQVHVSADAGNEYAVRCASFAVSVLQGATQIATATLTPTAGFAQGVIPLGSALSAANYSVTVTAKDSGGATLATATSATFTLPSNVFLGNTLGIPPAGSVQSPWPAISLNGLRLSVWGRVYDLTGGWGLPQQITSQNLSLLAAPIDVDFNIGAGVFHLVPQSLSITSANPDVVTWTGVGQANGIKGTINGTLEYDGNVTIQMTLQPVSSPVTIDTMALQMSMPAARALFWSTAAGGGGHVKDHNCAVPTTPGQFITGPPNVWVQNFTNLMPSIVLCDDTCGLEWWADSVQNWQITSDYSNPQQVFQSVNVDPSGNVRLENDLGLNSFSLSGPLVITWGYMATPVKQLPTVWPTTQFWDSSGGAPAVNGTLDLKIVNPGDSIRAGPPEIWRSYALTPGTDVDVTTDTATFLSRKAAEGWTNPAVQPVPYTQQHTPIGPQPADTPAFMSNEYSSPDSGYGSVGYVNMPTRGMQDYWAYWINYDITAGLILGLYMDEPFYGDNLSNALVSGNGWLDALGISRYGFNSKGARAIFKRLRQVFIDNGLVPHVWVNGSTGYVAPHMWSFVDIVGDGEGTGFITNFINSYNNATGLNWLRGMSSTRKFGFTEAFFCYVSPNSTDRTFMAMIGLHQINEQALFGNTGWVTYHQAMFNAGIVDQSPFTGYWANSAITEGTGTLLISYYQQAGQVFAHFANLTGSPFNGTINFSPGGLGWISGSATATNIESGPITVSGNSFPLSVSAQDYQVVLLDGTSAPPTGTLGFVETEM